jgi:hypothetical protein
MRLVVDVPPSWVVERRGEGQVIHVAGAPTLAVEVSPIVPLPDNSTAWAQAQLSAGLPPGTKLHVVVASDLTTAGGWPLSVIQSQALTTDTNAIAESRLHNVYTRLLHGAIATVRGTNLEEFDAHRAEILDAFGRARPDWGQDIVALGQIIDIDEVPVAPRPPAS